MKRRMPEKLLGCTADHLTVFSPPIPYDSDEAISAAAAILCELKRSSSVNNSINLGLPNHPREAEMEATNEEQMSSFENGFGDKDGEKKEETEEKLEEKKGQGRKRREREMESSGSEAMIKCKKTDGKGWHCKRLAQNPHSLCSYHLTQLRSYRTRLDDHVSGDHRKKFAFSVDSGGAASNYYYYYPILGSWWGKRRGPVNESSEGHEKNGISSKDCNESEAAVDVDTVEEEEEDDDEEEEDYGESNGNVTYMKKKKKTNRMINRKGRKPVKARSLKSLL